MPFVNKVQSETDINCRKEIYILQDRPTVFMLQTVYIQGVPTKETEDKKI